MRLRNRLNGLLLIGVATLAGLAWYTAGRDPGPAPLTRADPRAIEQLTLEFPRGERPAEVQLERHRDGWHLTSPIERPARDGRVVSALAVLTARSNSCYPAAERRLAEFGLEPPRLRLTAGDARVAFGDRAADGRRYVLAGERLCLINDRSYPLLARGLDNLASATLLPAGARPTRIATPAAETRRTDEGTGWTFSRGHGDGSAWADRWQGASATGFTLDPPATDLGLIRIATDAGRIHEWRIAAREPDLVLVPPGADYGLVIAPERARALLAPPEQGQAGTTDEHDWRFGSSRRMEEPRMNTD